MRDPYTILGLTPTALHVNGYLTVNGAKYGGMLPSLPDRFGVHRAGKVELKDGENEIAVERGWGYYDLDYVELVPAPAPPPLRKPPRAPVDRQASPGARRLMAMLVDAYGKTTLSGQYNLDEAEFIRKA